MRGPQMAWHPFKMGRGQNSSGGSDIEVISRDGADRFTFVDVTKGSTRHTGDVPAKPHTTEIQPSALSKDATPPHSSDSSPCGTPESFDESSASNADQWSRSIIIENVPQDMFSTLGLLLQNKSIGGGNIITYKRVPTSNHVLAVFEEIQVADRFLAHKSISMLGKSCDIHVPVEEEPKTESIPPEEVDEFKDREAEERSRTVEVHGVQSQDIALTIMALLENTRKGEGFVEEDFLNESKGILTVKFRDKKCAEHFLRQEVISVFQLRYYVRHPLSSMTGSLPRMLVTGGPSHSTDQQDTKTYSTSIL